MWDGHVQRAVRCPNVLVRFKGIWKRRWRGEVLETREMRWSDGETMEEMPKGSFWRTNRLWDKLQKWWEGKKKLRVVRPLDSADSIDYHRQVYEWVESDGMLGFLKDHTLVFFNILLYSGLLAGVAVATVQLRRWQVYGGGVCDLSGSSDEDLQEHINECTQLSGNILWKGWHLPVLALHALLTYVLYILFPMGLYNPLIGFILYGKTFFVRGDKARLWSILAISLVLTAVTQAGLEVAATAIIAVSWIYINIMVGVRLVRKSGQRSLKQLWVFSQMLQAASSALLLEFFPLAITRYVGAFSLSILRFIIFPVSVETTLIAFRIVARQCTKSKPGVQGSLLLLPIVWRVIYGRFLLVQFEAVGNVATFNLLLVIYGVISTISTRDGDSWIYSVQYGQRVADALLSTKESTDTAVWMRFVNIICEIVAIPATAALYTFAKVADASGDLTDAKTLWLSYSIQLITVVLGFYASMIADSLYNGLHMARAWNTRGKRLLTWLAVLILVIFVPLNYVYLMSIFFCPSRSQVHGIVLEACDRPALF